jgi:hypothetical protein
MKRLSILAAALALVLTAVPALAAGPSVTVNGPSNVTIINGCQNVVWTASVSGGAPPYTLYEWKRNGVAVGANSSTLTLQYCTILGQDQLFTDTITCTVADSDGREGAGSKNTTFNLQG